MTSPLAAKATFSRHAACEMWKKQRQFFCRNVIFSVLQYLSPCSATTPFFFFFSWVTLAMHHGLFPHHPSHLLLQVPQDLAFPNARLFHTHFSTPTPNAHLAFRNPAHKGCLPLLGGALGMEEDLADPKSSSGLQQQGTPPRAGYMSHCLTVTDPHCKAPAAPCAAGGEIWEALGHCCEAVRNLSVLLFGQWHQAKGEPMLLVLCKQEWCAYEPSDAFQTHPPSPCLLECCWSWTSLCADVWESFALTLHWCKCLHEVWGSGESGSRGLLTRWQIINDSVQYKCNIRNSEIKAFACQAFVCHSSNKLPA